MDPNECLKNMRTLAARIIDGDYSVTDCGARALSDAAELAAHVEALDDWLARGGFLPEDWAAGRSDL